MMTTYISILRGINVGGNKPITMDALKKMYADVGFTNVHTYIQSGNVVFTCKQTPTKKLEQQISQAIATTFGFEVPVLAIALDEFAQIVKNNPFVTDKTKEAAHLHVTFLAAEPTQAAIETTQATNFAPDEFTLIGKAIYVYCPNGYGNTKLTNTFFETKLKLSATTRNWKTTNELLSIATKNI